jgi:preprotein translocase subunit SecF
MIKNTNDTAQTAAVESHIVGIVIKTVIPFLKMRWFAFILSGGIVIGGAVGLILNKGFNLGIDFKGGIKVEVQVNKPDVTINDIRKIYSDAKVEADINTVGNPQDRHFMITVPIAEGETTAQVDKATSYLDNAYGQDKVDVQSTQSVEAKMGQTFVARTLQLMAIVGIMIVLYIIFRFDFYYSVGALVATLHDILIMLAFAMFFKIPIDITIIAAILTIMGYSINDTIVVYDRIRELVKLNKDEDLEYTMDRSITQTLSRTIITVLTVVFVTIAIYIWGGVVLHNFAFLLLVGLISGTYSSIFVSAPIVLLAKRSWDKNFKNQKKIVAHV